MKKFSDLKNRIVLSEMAGYTDGEFCAINGKDAALVMIGTYIISDLLSINYPKDFIFKPDKRDYFDYLVKNIFYAKKSGAKVGVSAVSIDIEDSVDFLIAAEEAGADYASYCAHSIMDIFISNNTSSALLLKDNRNRLREAIRTMVYKIKIPIIFKIGAFDNDNVLEAIDIIKEEGIDLIHINIGSNKKNLEGHEFLKKINRENLFIIAGGRVKNFNNARDIINSGADAVSIATASIKKPDLISRINSEMILFKNFKSDDYIELK
ncbi:MAG: HisA/HisF-related TIM barrel protein [Actinomycetota bacterium]|nr:HisA/HisF-related TIM barrel protein [Actinomycetota bacterium]